MQRRVVLLIHGYGEHIFRAQYTRLTQNLVNWGWDVRRHIIREHWDGRHDGATPTFYFDDFAVLLSDLVHQIYEIKDEDGGSEMSLVLIGKSLGGLLTIRCLEELPADLRDIVKGGIALSPCLQIGTKYDTPLKRLLAYTVDYLGMDWVYSPFDQLLVTDVTKSVDEYSTDPYILSRGVWAAVAVATRNETFIAHKRRDQLDRALLILHGSNDQVCECGTSRDFVHHTTPHSQIETYENTAHDLLDEGDQVLERIYWRIESFLLRMAD